MLIVHFLRTEKEAYSKRIFFLFTFAFMFINWLILWNFEWTSNNFHCKMVYGQSILCAKAFVHTMGSMLVLLVYILLHIFMPKVAILHRWDALYLKHLFLSMHVIFFVSLYLKIANRLQAPNHNRNKPFGSSGTQKRLINCVWHNCLTHFCGARLLWRFHKHPLFCQN